MITSLPAYSVPLVDIPLNDLKLQMDPDSFSVSDKYQSNTFSHLAEEGYN